LLSENHPKDQLLLRRKNTYVLQEVLPYVRMKTQPSRQADLLSSKYFLRSIFLIPTLLPCLTLELLMEPLLCRLC